MDELSQIKKIIAVTTYGRAGSGLISSLMDGQNNILSLFANLPKGFTLEMSWIKYFI